MLMEQQTFMSAYCGPGLGSGTDNKTVTQIPSVFLDYSMFEKLKIKGNK